MHFLLLGSLDVDTDVMTREHAAVLTRPPEAPHIDDLDEVDIRSFSALMESRIGTTARTSMERSKGTQSLPAAPPMEPSPSFAKVDETFMSLLRENSTKMIERAISLAAAAAAADGNGGHRIC